jgi:Zn-dependent protease with chaperone function
MESKLSIKDRVTNLFINAEPFENAEFDSLAERMFVRKQLREKGRYVFSKGIWLNAKAKDDYVEFSRELYDNLTSAERLALVAHEFGHIRERHMCLIVKRLVIPSSVLSLPFLIIGLSCGWVAAFTTFLISVVVIAFGFAHILNLEYLELEADMISAYYVDPKYLESALWKIKQLRLCSKEPIEAYVAGLLSPRTHPAVERRVLCLRLLGVTESKTSS